MEKMSLNDQSTRNQNAAMAGKMRAAAEAPTA
jgi:hypothetical protein